jgi:predicted dinucleotide-binding enzyme
MSWVFMVTITVLSDMNRAPTAGDSRIPIDATNRFAPEHLEGESNAELIKRMAPEGKVVKAINTIFAAHQANPLIDAIQLDGFVAGDDVEAKQKVLEFIGSLGFRPIDAGPLPMSRALEGMAVLNISLNMTNGWPWQTGWKLLGPTEGNLATTGRAQE